MIPAQGDFLTFSAKETRLLLSPRSPILHSLAFSGTVLPRRHYAFRVMDLSQINPEINRACLSHVIPYDSLLAKLIPPKSQQDVIPPFELNFEFFQG